MHNYISRELIIKSKVKQTVTQSQRQSMQMKQSG